MTTFDSLGYIPGHIHAFWLIYKKIHAEEKYGSGGFICAFLYSFYSMLGISFNNLPSVDAGNGHYEPLNQNPNQINAQQPPYYNNYGATG